MSDEAPNPACQYEWSFQKPRNIGILPPSNSSLPPITNQSAAFKAANKTGTAQHIPYSGPTLWNPRYQQRSPDKFLTLTPLRPSQKSVDSSIPVISITPRRGSREFSFFGHNLDDNEGSDSNQIDSTQSFQRDNHHVTEIDQDDDLQKLSTDDIMNKLGLLTFQKKKKKEQVSIFPDVYALVRSPRRSGRKPVENSSKSPKVIHFGREMDSKYNTQPSPIRAVCSKPTQIGHSCLPPIQGTASNSNSTQQYSLEDKNIQDYGTLYSRQQDALYDRLTREPTVINPAPTVGFRYVFPKSEKEMNSKSNDVDDNGLLKPQTQSRLSSKSQSQAQYHRNRLKDRRSYIRWNVHRNKSKTINDSNTDCDQSDFDKTQSVSLVSGTEKERQLRAISDKLQRKDSGYSNLMSNSKSMAQQSSGRNEIQTPSSTRRRIAAHFCDVLGQKTCQRCQEFYAKNYQVPAKEAVERVRNTSPVSRENTFTTIPTVGLQKVVIRVKDQTGKMAIATEEINRQLL